MYEPDSPEESLAKRILNEAKHILSDTPYPRFLRVSKETVTLELEQEQVQIDLGNGHSLTVTFLKRTA